MSIIDKLFNRFSNNSKVTEATPQFYSKSKKVAQLQAAVAGFEQKILGFQRTCQELEEKTKRLTTKAKNKTATVDELHELHKQIIFFTRNYFNQMTGGLASQISEALKSLKEEEQPAEDLQAISACERTFQALFTEKNIHAWDKQTTALQKNITILYLPITARSFNGCLPFELSPAPEPTSAPTLKA